MGVSAATVQILYEIALGLLWRSRLFSESQSLPTFLSQAIALDRIAVRRRIYRYLRYLNRRVGNEDHPLTCIRSHSTYQVGSALGACTADGSPVAQR